MINQAINEYKFLKEKLKRVNSPMTVDDFIGLLSTFIEDLEGIRDGEYKSKICKGFDAAYKLWEEGKQ